MADEKLKELSRQMDIAFSWFCTAVGSLAPEMQEIAKEVKIINQKLLPFFGYSTQTKKKKRKGKRKCQVIG